jgi:thiamine monophosphate synthase
VKSVQEAEQAKMDGADYVGSGAGECEQFVWTGI